MVIGTDCICIGKCKSYINTITTMEAPSLIINQKQVIIEWVTVVQNKISNFSVIRDRPFNLQGGGVMVFCFIQNFFFRTTQELEYYFFLSCKARNFFPEFNIRLYDKNSESDYSFFPPPKSEYFFQQHWESEYFFRKKTITLPPFKLNGHSLTWQVPDTFNEMMIMSAMYWTNMLNCIFTVLSHWNTRQQVTHVAPLELRHIILIPSQPEVWSYSLKLCA